MCATALFGTAPDARADLVGHWFTGPENLQDSSLHSALGTHDGVAVGGNAGLLTYSTDLPPGFTSGKSLDLTATNVAVQIANTSTEDGLTYVNTFDEGVQSKLTVAFWAKGLPNGWAPWISKRGEDGVGWQVRRYSSDPYPCFTLRGLSPNDNGNGGTINIDDTPPKWHHYVAVWDQAAATRTFYVDGALSHVVTNVPGETMTLSANRHLALGGRQGNGSGFDSYFAGLLFDVRIYNSTLTQTEVHNLIPQVAPLGLAAVAGNQKVNLSWTASPSATQYTVSTTNTLTSVEVTDIVPAPAPGVVPVFVKTGLTNNVPYLFKVLATNGGGSGPYSDAISATPILGSAKNILTFQFDGYGAGSISGSNITKAVPIATDVTNLTVHYTVSPFATGDVAFPSGSARNFSTPQSYTITAEDGSTQVYTVTVSKIDPVTFDFATGLQDWTQIWPIPGLLPLWENEGLGTPEGPTADGAETRLGRSPDFFLNGSGALSFQLGGGSGKLVTPGFGPSDIPEYSIQNGGFAGVALRDVATNTYLLTKRRVGDGPDYLTYSFTAAELAPYANDGKRYTLDFIDYNKGDWGWTRLDNVSIPGVLAPVLPVTPEANITSFTYLDRAKIDGTTITLPALPAGTPVTALAPTFTLSAGATCNKASGSPQNFTSPVTYTVTSSDSATIKVYTVVAVVLPQPAAALVGHWISGAETLADSSNYTPSGTHDGVAVGSNAGALTYSSEVPAGFTGKSLDLSGNMAVQISNSATSDGAGYQTTFDEQIRGQITVAFWAKGFPAQWSPWVAKGGEGAGWQLRRHDNNPVAGFTIRGLGDEDGGGSQINVNNADWHHFAGVWDQATGIRSLYVDGVLSHNTVSRTGVMSLAAGQHLILGGRQNNGVDYDNIFTGKLYDVRIYKQKLFADQVQALMVPPAPPGLFSVWINANYPGLSDKTAGGDPDGDGITNLQEFAFGLDPSSPSLSPIIAQPDKTTGVFRYTRLGTSGLVYTVQTSTNLVNWVPDTGATAAQLVTETNDGVETVQVTLTGAPLSGSKFFVRVSAQ